jgi:hypothetical protein
VRGVCANSLLPVAQQWGGELLSEAEWWRGQAEAAQGPSTMSRRAMVPLPIGYADREEWK